jgi:glycosyltransferase involved in cell wall biosynthesis
MSRKLRVLWCGESSFLNTGYAIYAKEVLSRLYETNKYEIAELGCYASINNPQRFDIPWRFYATLPTDAQEANAYNANLNSYQFGEWRFEDVCLDFRPDVVIDIRDNWMMEFEERSPFRPFYTWAIMPTVDSTPQQEQYLATYMNADAVFTYSEFGKEVLENESYGKINVLGIASPGANFDVFKPVANKNAHRETSGFVENINLIGTVMRNQRRKLYPNLIESFRKMLDNNLDLQANTFLYIHTSYPDIGWDIPKLIRNNNMCNHTLLTYVCDSCQHFFPSFFQDAKMACPRCGEPNAKLPSTTRGVSGEQFNDIFNWFDLYVQYSICEGFGMPQVEAAACGVPLMTVDYSAMQSVGKNLKGILIDVPHFTWDGPTGSKRAVPDDNDLVDKMTRFIKQPRGMKIKKGMDAYMGVKRRYTWEHAATIWEDYLDGVQIRPWSETWDSRPRIFQPKTDPPTNLVNEEFVRWIIANTWCERDKMNSYTALRLLRDLNYGSAIGHSSGIYHNEESFLHQQVQYSPFSRDDAVAEMKKMCDKRNHWEKCRTDSRYEKPYFIKTAKPDQKEIKSHKGIF